MSLRDAFINAAGPSEEIVDVPALDRKVLVRGMNVADFTQYVKALEAGNVVVTTVIRSSFDPESGDRLFKDADAEFLSSKPMELFAEIFAAARRLSGLMASDDEVSAGVKVIGSDGSSSS